MISVVIPMHNGAATIRRTLTSVFQQSIPPAEVIVVDDGSRDAGSEVVRDLFPSVVLVSTGGQPVGGAEARNVGALAANCSYIAFLDADDVWYPRKLELQLPLIAQVDVRLVGALMHYLTPTGEVLGTNDRYASWEAATAELRRGEAMPLALSSLVVSREDFLAVGGFDPQFRRSMDLDLAVRLVSLGGLLAWPTGEYLVGYLIQGGSATSSNYRGQYLSAEYIRARESGLFPHSTYQEFLDHRRFSLKTWRAMTAGLAYRKAAIARGEHRTLSLLSNGALAACSDPRSVLDKLRWARVGRAPGQPLPPSIAQLFAREPRT